MTDTFGEWLVDNLIASFEATEETGSTEEEKEADYVEYDVLRQVAVKLFGIDMLKAILIDVKNMSKQHGLIKDLEYSRI